MPRQRINGGIIGPYNPVTNSLAQGVFSLEDYRIGELTSWPGDNTNLLFADPNFNRNVLLIHADGSNNGNNNVFIDSGNSAFTVTRGGTASQGTYTPFSQTGWSTHFDGAGDDLRTAGVSQFDLGSGSYTIEGWFWFSSVANAPHLWQIGTASGTRLGLYLLSAKLSLNLNGAGVELTGTSTIAVGKWYHIAVTKSGSTSTLWLDGVSEGSVTTATMPSGNNILCIGFQNFGASEGDRLNGYVSNFRVSNSARYSSTFTPATSPFTSDANTVFLSCASYRHVDLSTNALAITKTGESAAVPYSPFAPTQSYSTSSIGGSVYLNGTTDYITIPDNATIEIANSNFTAECWMYPLPTSANPASGATIMGKSNSSAFGPFLISFNSSTGLLQGLLSSNGTGWATTVTAAAGNTFTNLRGQWSHVAFVRNGTGITLYLNGASVGTGTHSTALVDNAETYKLGWNNSVNTFFPGYITDARLVIGSAVYTGTFTPPSAPLATVAGTAFLFKGTNSTVIDSTAKNNIITVGNAITSTAQAEFGATSLYFDGTGDWLNIPHNYYQQLRSSDFTIECWAYPTAGAGTNRGVISKGTATTGWSLIATSGNVWGFITSSTTTSGSVGVTLNTWVHLALVRSGTTVTLWVDGVSAATATVSTDFTETAPLYVGCGRAEDIPFTGYIDEVRISRVARYTAAFTPPPIAFNNL